MRQALFLAAISDPDVDISHAFKPRPDPENTTLDQERREIVASVLGVLAGNHSDPDQMAACSRLLKHLADTTARPGCTA